MLRLLSELALDLPRLLEQEIVSEGRGVGATQCPLPRSNQHCLSGRDGRETAVTGRKRVDSFRGSRSWARDFDDFRL